MNDHNGNSLSFFLIHFFFFLGGLPNTDKEYKIVSRLTDKVLEVKGASTDNCIPIIQNDYHGDLNQYWRFQKCCNNTYHIISCASGKAMDVHGGSKESGAEIVQNSLRSESVKSLKTFSNFLATRNFLSVDTYVFFAGLASRSTSNPSETNSSAFELFIAEKC